ncbi:hypothetical protein [Stappia sp.]|uniref:hypothetical protein n=1 Tax=Stappia sp. TaxID=1870903 RepID=UPI003D0C7605
MGMKRDWQTSKLILPAARRLTRRALFGGGLASGGLALAGLVSSPLGLRPAAAAVRVADLRGTIDAAEFGIRPGAADDQSSLMQQAIDAAASRGRALFLPGGRYTVANLRLPSGARLVGLPGQTRFDYQGGGHLVFSEGAKSVGMEGIISTATTSCLASTPRR